MPKQKNTAERDEAIAHLRTLIRPGDVVYTIIRSFAKSGASRVLDVYVMSLDVDGKPVLVYVTGYVAEALEYTRTKDGVRVHGGGMDMCFATVYALGQALFPDGGDVNKSTRATAKDRAKRGAKEVNGGYLLRSEVL